jgi:hypothetical protein
VLGGAVAIGEQAGRLEDDVDAEILPRQLRRIAHRQHLELVAVDDDRIALGLDFRVQVAEHRIVFEQMRQRMRAREIVHRDEVDVVVAERRTHDVAADAAEAVNPYPDSHAILRDLSRRTNVLSYNTPSRCTPSTACSRSSPSCSCRPYFVYQAIRYKKYIGSLRQRLGFLPISFNFDGEESIWIHAVSVGEALTAARWPPTSSPLSAAAPVPVDDDDCRAAGGAPQSSRTWMRCSIFRSIGPSSSAGR